MYPPSQAQIVWGNQQYPSVPRGPSSRSDGNLWGYNFRSIMGILQIVCGVIGFALGVTVICLPVGYYFDTIDLVGWGLWNGIFATVTGSFGITSKKKKGALCVTCGESLIFTYNHQVVIAYMVTSIIAAVLGAGCFFYAAAGAPRARWSSYDRSANLAMYIFMCIVSFIQIVVSIIGASFTCGAVFSNTYHSQQMVYYVTSPAQVQQYGPAPQYALVAGQQFHVPQNTQHFQSSTPNNQAQRYGPEPSAVFVAAQKFNAP